MDNAEEVMHSLEEFSKLKPKDIPRELDDYLGYVAKTGDPVFKWSIIKCLFREKLMNVITDFHESTLSIELPPCPNVDTFNYERMKANLLERLDSFNGAPFTVQRISELLTNPRKEYNRADKFMRAIEKNILVVSIREPGRYSEIDGDNQSDPSFNGIPEPNDASIETSFTCNDLTDPDSSSQIYEVVNSDNHDTTYPVSLDGNASEAQVSNKSENVIEDGSTSGTSSDDSQEESLIEINNVEEKSESIANDKESDTVICSTVTSHPQEEDQVEDTVENASDECSVDSNVLPNNSENSSVEEVSNNTPSTEMEHDTVIDSSSMENIENSDSTKQPSLDNSESDLNLETVSEANSEETIPEENPSNESIKVELEEQKEAIPVVCESDQKISNEDAPVVFVDDRTVECDTSNSLESENSCDQEKNEQYVANDETKTTEEVEDIVEDNEVSSCQETLNEKENEETTSDDNTRETSVIHTTSNPEYTEPMEVDESQVAVADQSTE